MTDTTKLAKAIASKLYKTKSFYVHGDIKKKIDSSINIFDDLQVKFKGMEDFTKGQLLDLSDITLKLVTYKESNTTEYAQTLLDNARKHTEIFQNTKRAGDYFMFDNKEREIMEIDPKILLNMMSKESRSESIRNMRLAKITFDAFNPDPVIPVLNTTLNVPILLLNTYKPPLWQVKYPLPIKESHREEIHELMLRYINFIFPVEEERLIFLAWVANALTSRHQSFLHLRGARGNGKSILAKVVGALISYCYEAKDGVSPDGFNADLKHKRLVIIDDDSFIGTRAGDLFRKRLTNSSVAYNEKFVQTTKTEKQYASYIICSNPDDRFFVRCDERKMVQLELNTQNINTVMSTKELSFLDDLLKVDDSDYSDKELRFLAHLGHYVLSLSKDNLYSVTHNYLGGCFWSDVIRSLGAFKKHCVNTILSCEKDSYTYEDLFYSFEDVKTNRQVAATFETISIFLLSDFKYKGNSLVERVNKQDKILYVSKYYRASFNAFDNEEFNL